MKSKLTNVYNIDMRTNIDQFVYSLLALFNKDKTEVHSMEIKGAVKRTVSDYKSTIKFLGLYDKGKVSTPQAVVKHSNLRDYLQSV